VMNLRRFSTAIIRSPRRRGRAASEALRGRAPSRLTGAFNDQRVGEQPGASPGARRAPSARCLTGSQMP
jgi:hypothetical protein